MLRNCGQQHTINSGASNNTASTNTLASTFDHNTHLNSRFLLWYTCICLQLSVSISISFNRIKFSWHWTFRTFNCYRTNKRRKSKFTLRYQHIVYPNSKTMHVCLWASD